MPPKRKDSAPELAEKMLAVLEAQCALGKEAYPLTLQRLAELADPQAAPELIGKAVGKKPFKDRAVLASSKTKDPAGLVALADDTEQLADDARLLEFALGTLCTVEDPLWPLSKVKAQIENPKLRKPFEEAVARRVRENALPSGVGVRLEKNKPLLYLMTFPPPPPPPPPRKPEEVLAEKLLQVLEAQRRLGGDAYPLLLQRLVERTDPQAKSSIRAKALGHPIFRDKVLRFDLKKPEALVAFLEDKEQLFSCGILLEQLLRMKCKANDNAFAVEKLVSPKSEHFPIFREAINRRIDADTLPPTIGWMWIGKKKQLFFTEDVHRGRQGGAPIAAPSQPSPPSEPPADFARAFDEAFHQINRQKGAHNFVNLVDLRRALPMAPEAFDAALRKLRVAGRYTLSAAEGRHGVTPEERQAGIVEDGSLLLYVSRKNP